MKPLLIITTYNRKERTQETLQALVATTDLNALKLVIVDNGSQDGTPSFLREWQAGIHHLASVAIHLLGGNLGCPRALNFVMEVYRKPGQAVIKMDNDVVIETPGWLPKLQQLFEVCPDMAMAGPWYGELVGADRLGKLTRAGDCAYYPAWPLLGHMVYHAGWFLDQVGYFDVLADDHLYGFEDLLLSQKAAMLGHQVGVLSGITVQMIQRKNSLDVRGAETRDEHVARMRPEYDRRVGLIRRGAYIYTDNRGQPRKE